ncbi:MAG TPA: OsmC family protein, partial [Polyangiaceae bacterium]|nr:OsmC family protein [Polyangiaceae bacterium]
MDIELSFPGGKRVVAQLGAHRIETDQPVALGGQDAAPAPFDLFLASIATCAGIYALGFLQARGLSTEGLRLTQHVDLDEATRLPRNIRLSLTLPADLPEKYRGALVRTVENCKV